MTLWENYTEPEIKEMYNVLILVDSVPQWHIFLCSSLIFLVALMKYICDIYEHVLL